MLATDPPAHDEGAWMRDDDREPDRDTRFLREAEQEQDPRHRPHPRSNEDGMVRDRQAAQQRERLRDAEEAVRNLPDDQDPEEPT